MIAIIDYGMGNLRSVQKALENVGARTVITSNPASLSEANKIVLPGVGAIEPAMAKLRSLGMIDAIKNNVAFGKPFLGICLGLQLLFDQSSEGGRVAGMGVVPGFVDRFQQLKVPHMGWNQLRMTQPDSPMYRGISSGANVYFCHSYYVIPKDQAVVATTTEYGVTFVSSICKGNLWGMQFHPEKSQRVGLQMLRNFVELAA